MTIQELATNYCMMFGRKERPNGDKFTCVKDEYDNDETLKQLIRDAHGDHMPDDFIYDTIIEALDTIGDTVADYDLNYLNMEADVYNSDLLKWLASHSDRVGYCDEILAEYGHGINLDLMEIIQHAQQREKEEILHSVIESLETILEDNQNA